MNDSIGPQFDPPAAGYVRDVERVIGQPGAPDEPDAEVLSDWRSHYVVDDEPALWLAITGRAPGGNRYGFKMTAPHAFELGAWLMEHALHAEEGPSVALMARSSLTLIRRVMTLIGMTDADEIRRQVRERVEERTFIAARRAIEDAAAGEVKRIRIAVVTLARAAAAQTQRERDQLLQDDEVVAVVKSCLESLAAQPRSPASLAATQSPVA